VKRGLNRLLIVQPWFCSFGHPAQSLVNLASAIGKDDRVEYLVSSNKGHRSELNSVCRIEVSGVVHSFVSRDPAGTGRWNTVKALWAIYCLQKAGHLYQRILFFDASLVMLALFWPLFSLIIDIKRLSVLHLHGPEPMNRSLLNKRAVQHFLLRSEVRLYLRTEELAKAWANSYTRVPNDHIRHLPSLEIPDENQHRDSPKPSEYLRFGIVGQVRPGKGIDWLVPFFQKNLLIGKLTVAGAFFNEECRERLSVLNGFEGFINHFMSEDEMLQQVSSLDYVLILYDDSWDSRMESAVLYLAARVSRPVITYRRGWVGRQVKKFGCGVLVPENCKEFAELLKPLPRPGSAEYSVLLKGVNAFKEEHSVKSLRSVVLDELFG